MSKQNSIKRYALIIERIQQKNNTSLNDIQLYLQEYGFEFSVRTLQRDIQEIRNEFAIEIVYNAKNNSYYIDQDQSLNSEVFQHFLEMSTRLDLLHQSIRNHASLSKYIGFDYNKDLKNIHHLDSLLDAAIKRKKIIFLHRNFNKKTIKEHCLHPYHLKEYNNRWYVIGFSESYQAMRTFALDRMEKIQITKENFSKVNFDAHTWFSSIIGVSEAEKKALEIQLQISQHQMQYFETLPIHHSQKILKQTKSHTIASLWIIPNYEFIQWVLSMRGEVKVVSPKAVVNQIKTIISAMLSDYN